MYKRQDLGCEKNELISMSGLVFPIESVKPDEIVEEVMSLIGNMYYGRKEDKDFKRKMYKRQSLHLFRLSLFPSNSA